ncbi:MAG: ABC transporter permease [Burkholderiales bacterium]
MKLSTIGPVSRVLARELAVTVLLLLGVSVVVFAILYLAPGDPLGVLLEGQLPRPEAALGMREAMGVPSTWYGQYAAWFGKVLQGNFGSSIRTGLPVLPELARVGVNTLFLTLGSLVFTTLIAVPIAIHAAAHGDTPGNTTATIVAYLFSAVPVFWFGYIVVYVFIHQFGLFPLISGTAGKQEHAWLYFLVPIFVLGTASGTLSEVIRQLREELSRVLAEDYIRTARAKGAPVWRHAFKEGFLIPVTEIMSAKIPFLLGGAVIVEQVFNWPGMGRMAWQAAQDRDFPVIMGIALVAAAFVRLGNLLQRVVFTAVDPRASRE